MNQDLSKMSKAELEERLNKLRMNRRVSYTPPQHKKSSPKVDQQFAGLSDDIAAKILAELSEVLGKKGD
jgi:hypothetical protein